MQFWVQSHFLLKNRKLGWDVLKALALFKTAISLLFLLQPQGLTTLAVCTEDESDEDTLQSTVEDFSSLPGWWTKWSCISLGFYPFGIYNSGDIFIIKSIYWTNIHTHTYIYIWSRERLYILNAYRPISIYFV